MRLTSAPEQLLSTAGYSLNDAFEGKAFMQHAVCNADSAAHYNAGCAWRLAERPGKAKARTEGLQAGGLKRGRAGAFCRRRCICAAGFGPLPLPAARKALLLLLIMSD